MGIRLMVTAFAASATFLVVSAAAQTTARPVLVELFTSEGCSSCPPADALLRRLQGMKTDGGQMIVALSEHVTYWNRLGWADPFSQQQFTDRQNAYGERFHLDSVYTPQVVVNGNREVLGSDGTAVLSAVRIQNSAATQMLKIESVKAVAEGFAVTFAVGGTVPKGVEVFAVVADDMDSSQVARGENAGRTLTHVAVARSLTRVATLIGAEAMTVTVPMAGDGKGQQHIVLFAQAAGQGNVLSVASVTVPQEPLQTAVQSAAR